jgi:aminoglycoside 6-adenylyltransferase
MTSQTYESLEAAFVRWARDEDDVRAVIAVGSRARIEPPADDWSDLDIMVYTRAPDHLLARSAWLDQIAPVLITIPGRTAGGEPEILVMFDGGFDVDVVVGRIGDLADAARAGTVPHGHLRGARVLVDKDGWAARTIPATFGPPMAGDPDAEEFQAVVAGFWYGTHYVAKQIRRGDLWVVKVRDAELKAVLLRMLEWHARTTTPEVDTWHMGRYFWQWADPRAVDALDAVFGHFDRDDSWRALMATADLFTWLATEVADQLGIPYPTSIEATVRGLIDQLHAPDPG